ncbi:MAG: c-type cytochrome domain-containing protein [Bryobacterales bacterium]
MKVPDTCTPQYDPTFDNVWGNTLSTSCALGGCHGAGAASGGLSMGSDADAAYEALAGGYVEPGDPGCSLVVDHLEPDGLGDMPPGRVLDEAERCAVRTWIAQGAAR